jgi:hypothetical protein
MDQRHSGVFWFSEKIFASCSLFVLDSTNRTNIIAPSSPGEGRVMTVHHDAGLDAVAATMPGLESSRITDGTSGSRGEEGD